MKTGISEESFKSAAVKLNWLKLSIKKVEVEVLKNGDVKNTFEPHIFWNI
jgi:hypothetical protein